MPAAELKTRPETAPSAAELRRGRVAIIDFGSQFTQLIARRVREIGIYAEIHSPNDPDAVSDCSALILSGGPSSVYDDGAPRLPAGLLDRNVPILGICYGFQLLSHSLGGKVIPGSKREYGIAQLGLKSKSPLLDGVPDLSSIWMSHGDKVQSLAPGFEAIAATDNCEFAATQDADRRRYGIQFHPEVVHTRYGRRILENFLLRIAGLEPNWSMERFLESIAREIRSRVGDRRVLLALSGGVDSSVLAALLEHAIPGQTDMLFVDTGLLLANEAERVRGIFGSFAGFRVVPAAERFLSVLHGKSEPEEKRKAIGRAFIEVFEEEARTLPSRPHFLAQGTLYPDRIESFSVRGPSASIKSHHNVGGLPERLGFELLEPLRDLFKDEVRKLGRSLGLAANVVDRHPLPGPALAIRTIGEVTPERVERSRQANRIVEEEIRSAGSYPSLWQAFAVLLPVRSVGVMGDGRTYEEVCSVRLVTSEDGMTADWEYPPRQVLQRISSRIVNEVRGINRVMLDITSKPPSTIEWE